ncbi:MAG: BlaI/MecI/CopY family transcriptional regulator [Polyangiaceae bacterium]
MAGDTELGPLEMKVLGLLGAESAAVGDLQQRLRQGGDDLAYTTVMTVLVRLCEKGMAVRSKEGRRFLYSAARRAPAVSRGILSRIQRSLFRGDRVRPILALLDDAELSDDDLRALRKTIDERLRRRG